MIEKSIPKRQWRLLRGGSRQKDTEKSGLSINDYDALCNANAFQPRQDTLATKSGRKLILK